MNEISMKTYINSVLLFQIKSIALTLAFTLFVFAANAQVSIGSLTPDASSQLDVVSTNKGLLIPRMSKTNRDGIASPATGLLIYQTDQTPGFYYYTGSEWVPLKETGGGGGGNAIIPFASGDPAFLTTTGGIAGTVSAIGFGDYIDVSLTGGIIDATAIRNMAFSVPRNGTITSLSGFFSNTSALILIGSLVSVQAQLYSAPEGSNTFTPIPGAVVEMSPMLTGIIAVGTTSTGRASGLSIPVTAGTRLMLVFSATANGLNLNNTVVGYASGGVAID
ncbi:exosporium glycoprotein BclB-related protein [Dyadobacter sp.]|uniref:exosporium glycoprotein BclB-related protein n=1 Tax=Dyadobacter sp. TaxID=1914288 RepID=UPI003F726024